MMRMTIVITIMIIIITIIVMIIVITIIIIKNFTAVRRRITDQILSLKGQHTGSRRKTLEAAVRFSPTPPAFSDSSITLGESGPRSSNNSITSDLFFCDILPSNRTKLNPFHSLVVSQCASVQYFPLVTATGFQQITTKFENMDFRLRISRCSDAL